jgi:hypothetical protein
MRLGAGARAGVFACAARLLRGKCLVLVRHVACASVWACAGQQYSTTEVTAAQSIFRLLSASPPPCALIQVPSHERRYQKRSDFWSHVRSSFAEKCGGPVSRMLVVSEEEVLDPGACQEDAVAALSGFRH